MSTTCACDDTQGTPHGLESVRFTYVVTEADGGYILECGDYSQGQFEAPSGSLISVSMTIVDPNDLELTVDVGVVTNAWGFDIGVGTKAGERVKAACKIRRKGVDPVDLVMGVGSEVWAGLKTTRRDEEVFVETTEDHVAKKEYHRRPVACFLRVDGKKWEAAGKNSSVDLNVFFEPTASLADDVLPGIVIAREKTATDKINDTVTAVRSNGVVSVTCNALAGNPENIYRWSVEVKEAGSDEPVPEHQVIETGLSNGPKYTVMVTTLRANLDFTCIVTNLVANGTRAHLKIEINNPRVENMVAIVDGKNSPGFYLMVDLGNDISKVIVLRCETMPKQARIRWWWLDRWLLPNMANGSDISIFVTKEHHRENVKCEANSGGSRTVGAQSFRMAYPNSIQGAWQEGRIYMIAVSGNPSFRGTSLNISLSSSACVVLPKKSALAVLKKSPKVLMMMKAAKLG